MSDEAAATIAPTEGRGKRERKQTAYLAPEAEPVKAAFVAKGSGTELGDIPYFSGMIEKFKDDDEPIRALHQLLIGSVGKKGQRKKLLRQFNGFDESITTLHTESKMSENKKKWTVPMLKDCSRILGVDTSGSRADLIKRIAEYVVSPYEIKTASAIPSKKRKSAGGKKVKKSRKAARTGEKRKGAVSAFMLYSKATRPGVKAENPDQSFGDLSTTVGAMWRGLDADEKQKWEAKAAALKAAAGDAVEDEEEEAKGADEEEEEGDEEEEEEDEEEEGDANGDDEEDQEEDEA